MYMSLMALLSSLAVLSGDASSSVLDSIMVLVPKAFTFVGTIINSIVSIDLFGMLLAISLVGVGIGLFSRMKNSVT